jgi:hypothetical protein
MDIRICLRVREQRDTDLILGQAPTPPAGTPHPERSRVSAPGRDVPRRARAYLLTEVLGGTGRAGRPERVRVASSSATDSDNSPKATSIGHGFRWSV